MLKITNQSDYGILFISSLVDKKDYIPLSDLLDKTKLPKRFLARIAAELVKNKVVESREGKVGGYRLTKKAQNISLYDYLKIFEGDLSLTRCTEQDYKCRWKNMCKHKSSLTNTLNQIVSKELKQKKLLDLFEN